MCGVAGILSLSAGAPPPSLEAIERMAAALGHRGPDGTGAYRDASCALVHTRLAIIDLEGGAQPLCGEEGRIWISFNGEIFNYVELREELVALGHRFETRSDTEAIVHAFEEWGEEAIPRFNGQFALALWDAREKELVLARDRVGILPLHWTEHRGQLWFASEVKALFAGNPELPRALDPEGLQDALTFWAPLAPRTAFRGVRQIPPGHVRRVRGNSVRERAYWQPAFPRRGAPELANKRFEDSAREVRSALERATALRTLRADVPVGSYLSGGLDSSMVAALGATARGAPLATFSLRFHDAEYDETPYQRQMAAALGGEHREIHIGRRDIARVFPDVVLHAERPLLRTAPAPLFLLSRLVRASGIKVVLTGEGADEVFAGYDLFREARVRRFWSRQPGSSARPALLQRLYPYLARSPVSRPAAARAFFGQDLGDAHTRGFGHGPRWRSAAALQRLLSPSLRDLLAARDPVAEFVATLPPQFDAWEPLAQDQTVEMRTLLSDYLLSAQGDRMLMAHSVEGRFPFLDPDVIDLAARLPSRHKLLGLQEKHVLKRAARGLVPAAIIDRTKQPFRAPDALCFVEQGSPDWIGEVISERALHDAGVFDPAAVGSLTRKCRANANTAQLSNADNMALVTVLSTQLLHEALVRKAPDIAPPRRFPLIDRLEGMSHG